MSLVISECVDFDLICEMDSKTFPEEDRITSSEYTQWFYDGNKIYSLKDDENMVGYIQLNGRYITGICVLPEYGRKGYATYMLEHKRKRKPHLIDMAMKYPDALVAADALTYHADKITPHHEEIARRRGLL